MSYARFQPVNLASIHAMRYTFVSVMSPNCGIEDDSRDRKHHTPPDSSPARLRAEHITALSMQATRNLLYVNMFLSTFPPYHFSHPAFLPLLSRSPILPPLRHRIPYFVIWLSDSRRRHQHLPALRVQ
jgi:hypothetical protein